MSEKDIGVAPHLRAVMLTLSKCSTPAAATTPEASHHLASGFCVLFNLDTAKARPLEPGHVITDDQCPADAADHRLHVLADRRRRPARPCHIGNRQTPLRASAHGESRGTPDPYPAPDSALRCRSSRQRNRHRPAGAFDIAFGIRRLTKPDFSSIGTGLLQHGVGHIHPDHLARRPDLLGSEEAVKTRAKLAPSSTVSPGCIAATACGLPQERPRFAPSGSEANSARGTAVNVMAKLLPHSRCSRRASRRLLRPWQPRHTAPSLPPLSKCFPS